MAKFFQFIWGIATLLSLGWLCYGMSIVLNVTDRQMARATSEAAQAGTAIGAGISSSIVLCTALPMLLIFGFLYWRNSVAIREARKHEQTIEAIRGSQQ